MGNFQNRAITPDLIEQFSYDDKLTQCLTLQLQGESVERQKQALQQSQLIFNGIFRYRKYDFSRPDMTSLSVQQGGQNVSAPSSPASANSPSGLSPGQHANASGFNLGADGLPVGDGVPSPEEVKRLQEVRARKTKEFEEQANKTRNAYLKEGEATQREAIVICFKLIKNNPDIAFVQMMFQMLIWFTEWSWPQDMTLVYTEYCYRRIGQATRFLEECQSVGFDAKKTADPQFGVDETGFRIPSVLYAYQLKHLSEYALHHLKTPDEKEMKFFQSWSEYEPILLELASSASSSSFRKRQLKVENLRKNGYQEEIFRKFELDAFERYDLYRVYADANRTVVRIPTKAENCKGLVRKMHVVGGGFAGPWGADGYGNANADGSGGPAMSKEEGAQLATPISEPRTFYHYMLKSKRSPMRDNQGKAVFRDLVTFGLVGQLVKFRNYIPGGGSSESSGPVRGGRGSLLWKPAVPSGGKIPAAAAKTANNANVDGDAVDGNESGNKHVVGENAGMVTGQADDTDSGVLVDLKDYVQNV